MSGGCRRRTKAAHVLFGSSCRVPTRLEQATRVRMFLTPAGYWSLKLTSDTRVIFSFRFVEILSRCKYQTCWPGSKDWRSAEAGPSAAAVHTRTSHLIRHWVRFCFLVEWPSWISAAGRSTRCDTETAGLETTQRFSRWADTLKTRGTHAAVSCLVRSGQAAGQTHDTKNFYI